MSEIYEAYRSGDTETSDSQRDGRAMIVYTVLGTTSAATARLLAAAESPLFIEVNDEQLIRQKCRVRTTGFDQWEGEVDYGPEDDPKSQEPPEPGMWRFSFSTTGGTQTIVLSRNVLNRFWGPFDEAPDVRGAIGWDGDRTVKGIERPIPSLKFTITAYYNPSQITTSFMRNIARKTARMNSDPWLGFDAGELLYFGGEGEGDIPTIAGQRIKPIAIHHLFEANENYEFTNGMLTEHDNDNLTVRGWDYLDIVFARSSNELGQIIPTAKYGFIHEIFEELAFGEFFGFGGEN